MTRSHFSAQDFAEMGTPGVRSTPTGALARLVAPLPGKGIAQSVSFSAQSPVAFRGPDEVLVTPKLQAFRLRAKAWQAEAEQQIRMMYEGTPLAQVGKDIFEACGIVRQVLEVAPAPSNGAAYPDSPTGSALRQAAQIIKAGIDTRCIFAGVVGTGDFDTHAGQLEKNARDYQSLGSAMAAFDQDLGRRIDDVVLVVSTEFGRAVFMNGSAGTDHGTGYCMLVLGGSVKGGNVYGRWPGLKKSQLFEERDLAVTTDFRDPFLTVARKHMGITDTGALFPNYTPDLKADLGFLA